MSNFLKNMFGFLFKSNVKRLSAAEFKAQFAQQPGKIIDVRTPAEYKAGHLKGAANIDWLAGDVQRNVGKFDTNETYYLYCASGNRSGQAANFLFERGFKNVFNIGGYSEHI